MKNKIAIGLISFMSLVACSKESSDDETSPAATDTVSSTLTTGTLVIDYAMAALSSAKAPSGSGLKLDSSQSSKFPNCSANGEPWDTVAGTRMEISNPLYPSRIFECQLGSSESPDTVLGAFAQNKTVLCSLEASIGTLEYTAEGKVYSDVAITPSTTCGWSDQSIAEMSGREIKGTVTAKSYASGDWQKSINVTVTGFVDFTIYYNVSATSVVFKQIEGWSQESRMATGGDSSVNSLIPSSATGTRGGVISIDLSNGILRAETGDTYWGRHTRLIAKGTLDTESGSFSSITELNGLFGQMNQSSSNGSTNMYGDAASVSGTSTAGFKYNQARYQCQDSNGCTVTSNVRTKGELDSSMPAASCSPSDKSCSGIDGISWGVTSADFDFLMLGAVWDSQSGTRTAYQSWLDAAGGLDFSTISKSSTL